MTISLAKTGGGFFRDYYTFLQQQMPLESQDCQTTTAFEQNKGHASGSSASVVSCKHTFCVIKWPLEHDRAFTLYQL